MALDLSNTRSVVFEELHTGQRVMWEEGRQEETVLVFSPSENYNEY